MPIVESAARIEIRGARENTLRDVDVDLPRRAITVVSGVSGSGKSSLVVDTLAAESQRQLNDMFSAFAQNRLPTYGQPVGGVGSAGIIWTSARFKASVRRGKLVRGVLPASQAKPCYLAGASASMRT